MAFVNAAMGQPPIEASVTRRAGNHHANLWTDSILQSVSSPYSASSYHERREALTKEIKEMLNELGKEKPIPTADNLLERFWTVAVVQCLGIGRYFQEETKLVLDYNYKYWNEEGIALDLNATALGFRTLRLNGYHVSADVFNVFKDDDGQFSCPVTTKEAHCELRSMLSLHRASEIVFPGETIMKDANIFTTKYLQHALKDWKESKLDKNQLINEVEYALKYPWRCNVPRWEARNCIELFRQDNTSSIMRSVSKENLLELAILDFNIVQCLHQSELKNISSWWTDSTVSQLDFFRHRHVEFYFWIACGLFEPEFGSSRLVFTKLYTLLTLLDDIYDTHGTLDELEPFTAALISRDISTTDNLPDYMKVSFTSVMELFDDIEKEADKKQKQEHNPDIKKYIGDYWEKYILSYFEDAKWIASNYTPTLDEFFSKYGSDSTGLRFTTTYSMLVMDIILSQHIFKELDFPSSKFQTLTPMIARLLDDSNDFEEQKEHGESVSSVTCFMRDNPQSTFEDALKHVENLLQCHFEDLTKECLESRQIPAPYRSFHLNAIARGLYYIYIDGDGYSYAHKDTKDAINKCFIEPIPL